MKKIIQITLILLVAFSCNKEKRYSKKLIKGEDWKVESIIADGNLINSNTTWSVQGDDIYESVSQVSWGNGATTFEWQFQDKGKTWVLNNLCNCNKAEGSTLTSFDYLADDLAGKYEVITHKRKEMFFRSSETKKYSGKMVEIRISNNF